MKSSLQRVCACGFEGPAQAFADDLEHLIKNDPRTNRQTNPVPFDGNRMTCGGFSPAVKLER
jgi:uncharacterized protein YbaA (DUF1428 family)